MADPSATRQQAIEEILSSLPQGNALLARLLFRKAAPTIPRGLASILGALNDRPHRITELAERVGVAQPTVTRMVARLAAQGLVRKKQQQHDRRVVLVEITAKGRLEIKQLRAAYAAVLRETLTQASDDDVYALLHGTRAVQSLIDLLRVR
jgi:DNA-binding MarR family transcriptional regulator